jgi:GNAT superfamily N-acetyltransferase
MTVRELLLPDTRLAHPAMSALRPAYRDEERFVQQIDGVQRPEGYRLVGAFVDDAAPAVAAAGFRLGHSLAWGRHLYVDDLSTLPEARRSGHAGALLDWILAEAQRLGCDQVHLDSGAIPERFDAHRLYFKHGYVIDAHHFSRRAPGA